MSSAGQSARHRILGNKQRRQEQGRGVVCAILWVPGRPYYSVIDRMGTCPSCRRILEVCGAFRIELVQAAQINAQGELTALRSPAYVTHHT
jgi:hypothetical protein